MYTKCLFLFSILILPICESKCKIDVNTQDGSRELEEAAIKILKTCYKNDKTVVLIGDSLGQFIKDLSHESFSLVLMNNRRRAKTITNFMGDKNPSIRWHKVNLVVAIAGNIEEFLNQFDTYVRSVYSNPLSAFLIIGYFANKKQGICVERDVFKFMANIDPERMLNMKMMCQIPSKEILIFQSNFFTNEVPKPWHAILKVSLRKSDFHLLSQIYKGNVEMCKNLDFDKTRSVGRFPIKVNPAIEARKFDKRLAPIYTILEHLNASIMFVSQINWNAIEIRPTLLKSIQTSRTEYSYPFRTECTFIVTQFRGYKSQLRKILDVIDIYSWIGISIVYIITLIFFKYFLRQRLIVAILNLVRLSSNMGLTILPSNVSPQIYLSCLLFFVVTIQGIFLSNLAALLTQDIPFRQVNSLEDLLELDYTVYVDKDLLNYFDQTDFKGRVIEKKINRDYVSLVQTNSSVATIIFGDDAKEYAESLYLYVSSTCLRDEYYSNVMPDFWSLKERYEELMGRMFAADILTPFDIMVHEKRLIEFQSRFDDEIIRVVTLWDLTFAFILLGGGLSVAILVFIAEITFFRFQSRIKKTRVIVE